MAYQTVPVQIAGPTAQNKSQQANSEFTKNWYPEITDRGRNVVELLPWMGSTLKTTTSGSTDRGTHVFKEVLYHVIGTTL